MDFVSTVLAGELGVERTAASLVVLGTRLGLPVGGYRGTLQVGREVAAPHLRGDKVPVVLGLHEEGRLALV